MTSRGARVAAGVLVVLLSLLAPVGVESSDIPLNRDALLEARSGFAQEVTGGAAGPTVHVTHGGDSGPGSLRAALADPNPAWIVFDSDLAIRLRSPLTFTSDKTVDGRGRNVSVLGRGLVLSDARNVIVTELDVRVIPLGWNTDTVRIDGQSDLIWLHRLTLGAAPDGTLDIVGEYAHGPMRVTVDWCRFSPTPSPELAAAGYTGGKASLQRGNVNTPANLRVTMHHNHFDRNRQRLPRTKNAWLHFYDNVVDRWGDADDVTPLEATEVLGTSSAWIESNVFLPFAAGETHPTQGTVVRPNTRAMRVTTPALVLGRDNLFLRQATTRGRGDALLPPLPYTSDIEPAGTDLADAVRSTAGTSP